MQASELQPGQFFWHDKQWGRCMYVGKDEVGYNFAHMDEGNLILRCCDDFDVTPLTVAGWDEPVNEPRPIYCGDLVVPHYDHGQVKFNNVYMVTRKNLDQIGFSHDNSRFYWWQDFRHATEVEIQWMQKTEQTDLVAGDQVICLDSTDLTAMKTGAICQVKTIEGTQLWLHDYDTGSYSKWRFRRATKEELAKWSMMIQTTPGEPDHEPNGYD